jgi:hypothetical protein
MIELLLVSGISNKDREDLVGEEGKEGRTKRRGLEGRLKQRETTKHSYHI